MKAEASVTKRLFHLAFAAVFLTAAEGQALGMRHCSLHDALPGSLVTAGSPGPDLTPGGSSGHHAPSDRDDADSARDHAKHHHDHGGGLGGCMDDCHVGSSLGTLDGSRVSLSLPLGPSTIGSAGPTAFDGPRRRPFELHLPNAPPLSS